MATVGTSNRERLVLQGQRLEYFTIGYNSLEGLVSIVAGIVAGSVSLIGFGLDSLIEVTSGAALLWRFHHDHGDYTPEGTTSGFLPAIRQKVFKERIGGIELPTR